MEIKKLLTVARAFENETQYEKSIDICLEILEKEKDNAEAMTIMGDCYFKMDLKDCALEMYNKAKMNNPDDYTVLYKQALTLISNEDYEKALDVLRECLNFENIPDDKKALIHAEICEIYYVTGKYSEAEKSINEAIKLSEDNSLYYEGLARLFYSWGKFDEAEAVYVKLLEEDNNREYDFMTLANIYIEKDEYEKGMKYLKKVVNKDHFNHSYILESYIYYMNGNLAKFKASLKKEHKFLKDVENIFSFIEYNTISLIKNAEYRKALKILEKGQSEKLSESEMERIDVLLNGVKIINSDFDNIKKLNKKDKNIINHIAETFVSSGLYEASIKIIDHGIKEEYGNESDLYFLKFFVYRNLGNEEMAIYCIDKAIELSEDGENEYHIEKVEFLFENGDKDNAFKIVNDRIDKTEKEEYLLFYNEFLGDYNFDLGNFDESNTYYEKCYDIRDKSGEIDFFILMKYVETLFNCDKIKEATKVLSDNAEYRFEKEFMLMEARISSREENNDKAIETYGELISTYPDFYVPYVDMANILIENGEVKAARNTLKKALKTVKTNSEEFEYISNFLNDIK